ncbi:hypothetical protein BKA81DRAFT_76420 [Phyllosticta paracitricarpa]
MIHRRKGYSAAYISKAGGTVACSKSRGAPDTRYSVPCVPRLLAPSAGCTRPHPPTCTRSVQPLRAPRKSSNEVRYLMFNNMPACGIGLILSRRLACRRRHPSHVLLKLDKEGTHKGPSNTVINSQTFPLFPSIRARWWPCCESRCKHIPNNSPLKNAIHLCRRHPPARWLEPFRNLPINNANLKC